MSNKETLIYTAKVFGVAVLGIIALITSAGVWNGVALGAIGGFYGVVAGLNLVAEGFGIYKLTKVLFKKPQ